MEATAGTQGRGSMRTTVPAWRGYAVGGRRLRLLLLPTALGRIPRTMHTVFSGRCYTHATASQSATHVRPTSVAALALFALNLRLFTRGYRLRA